MSDGFEQIDYHELANAYARKHSKKSGERWVALIEKHDVVVIFDGCVYDDDPAARSRQSGRIAQELKNIGIRCLSFGYDPEHAVLTTIVDCSRDRIAVVQEIVETQIEVTMLEIYGEL